MAQAPRFSQEYLIRMLANDSTHYLLLSLALLNDFPVLRAIPLPRYSSFLYL